MLNNGRWTLIYMRVVSLCCLCILYSQFWMMYCSRWLTIPSSHTRHSRPCCRSGQERLQSCRPRSPACSTGSAVDHRHCLRRFRHLYYGEDGDVMVRLAVCSAYSRVVLVLPWTRPEGSCRGLEKWSHDCGLDCFR